MDRERRINRSHEHRDQYDDHDRGYNFDERSSGYYRNSPREEKSRSSTERDHYHSRNVNSSHNSEHHRSLKDYDHEENYRSDRKYERDYEYNDNRERRGYADENGISYESNDYDRRSPRRSHSESYDYYGDDRDLKNNRYRGEEKTEYSQKDIYNDEEEKNNYVDKIYSSDDESSSTASEKDPIFDQSVRKERQNFAHIIISLFLFVVSVLISYSVHFFIDKAKRDVRSTGYLGANSGPSNFLNPVFTLTDTPTPRPSFNEESETPTKSNLIFTITPTKLPNARPSKSPTARPSKSPIFPTPAPTKRPSHQPTLKPTKYPTTPYPTNRPTKFPTKRPTRQPSMKPSPRPTISPKPTDSPTLKPTTEPTFPPPTLYPTVHPTGDPGWYNIFPSFEKNYPISFKRFSVSLSSDGSTMGVLHSYGISIYRQSGNENEWTLFGEEIPGANIAQGTLDSWDYIMGNSLVTARITLSKDGTEFLWDAAYDDEGRCIMYSYFEGTWLRRGVAGEYGISPGGAIYGASVAYATEDTNTIIVGAWGGNMVKVFYNSYADWYQLGNVLTGYEPTLLEQISNNNLNNPLFGASVAIDAKGETIAIASPAAFENNAGKVEIYRLNNLGTRWVQVGNAIKGQSSQDRFGILSLSGKFS